MGYSYEDRQQNKEPSKEEESFSGNIYTWTNGREANKRVYKRLDRLIINENWAEIMGQTLGFEELIEQVWNMCYLGNAMRVLQEKLKDLSRELSHCSKTSIGDIYEKVKFYEKIVEDKENIMDADPSEKNMQDLNKMAAEYTRYLGLQSSILQQKANLQWKEEEDSCSKYFFSVIKQKRRRNYIHRIQDENGYWIEDPNDIGNAAVRFYSNLFSNDSQQNGYDFGDLNQLHSIINHEDNEMLTRMPEEEEILVVIRDLSPERKKLTRFYTHSCLILIPKVEAPDSFSQMRPISLSFISGRLITENVILTQEIVHNMSKNKKKENMIIKLDMEKAYDRVSWLFYMWFLRKWEITGFTMEAKGPQINHIAYADDVVTFTSWKEKSLRRVMRQLRRYEQISGRKINAKKKSCFITATHTDREIRKKIKKVTGFYHKNFPFTYLGCPIFTGRKKICYFTEMTTKILKKAGAWQGNLLSFGGKAVIIQQLLQSQTMHLLAAISPPKYVLTQIEKYLQDIFWGEKECYMSCFHTLESVRVK
ncbi:uncharacterized protein LOC132624548 [Lycium barbarum]|uniref:uncharacterized protein LOC132624548 n=1 Tax=Lycium barbarum TaxID=112863 RepID=UPI00293F70BF|nr:uncharacterized protein LOC132624548 [Lycium barbarum]